MRYPEGITVTLADHRVTAIEVWKPAAPAADELRRRLQTARGRAWFTAALPLLRSYEQSGDAPALARLCAELIARDDAWGDLRGDLRYAWDKEPIADALTLVAERCNPADVSRLRQRLKAVKYPHEPSDLDWWCPLKELIQDQLGEHQPARTTPWVNAPAGVDIYAAEPPGLYWGNGCSARVATDGRNLYVSYPGFVKIVSRSTGQAVGRLAVGTSNALLVTPQGLWIGSEQGGLYFYDPDTNTVVRHPTDPVNALAFHDGTLWVAAGSRLLSLNVATGQLAPRGNVDGSALRLVALGLVDGQLWGYCYNNSSLWMLADTLVQLPGTVSHASAHGGRLWAFGPGPDQKLFRADFATRRLVEVPVESMGRDGLTLRESSQRTVFGSGGRDTHYYDPLVDRVRALPAAAVERQTPEESFPRVDKPLRVKNGRIHLGNGRVVAADPSALPFPVEHLFVGEHEFWTAGEDGPARVAQGRVTRHAVLVSPWKFQTGLVLEGAAYFSGGGALWRFQPDRRTMRRFSLDLLPMSEGFLIEAREGRLLLTDRQDPRRQLWFWPQEGRLGREYRPIPVTVPEPRGYPSYNEKQLPLLGGAQTGELDLGGKRYRFGPHGVLVCPVGQSVEDETPRLALHEETRVEPSPRPAPTARNDAELAFLLHDPDPRRRELAVRSNSKQGYWPSLAVASRDPDHSVRLTAIYRLGESGDERAQELLWERMTTDPDPSNASIAACWLVSWGPWHVLPEPAIMARFLRDNPDARFLLPMADSQDPGHLALVLEHPLRAGWAAAERQYERLARRLPAHPELLERLLQSDPEKGLAAGVVPRLGERARPLLAAGLRSPDLTVRRNAIAACVALPDPAWTAPLLELARGPELGVEALVALGKLGRPEALPLYIEALQKLDQHSEALLKASRGFPPGQAQSLYHHLAGLNWDPARREAALHLTDREALRKLAQEPHPYIWVQALATLWRLGEPVEERIRQNLPWMITALEPVPPEKLVALRGDLEALLPRKEVLVLVDQYPQLGRPELYRRLAAGGGPEQEVAARHARDPEVLWKLFRSGATTETRIRAYASLLVTGEEVPLLEELDVSERGWGFDFDEHSAELLDPILLELARVSDRSRLQFLREQLDVISRSDNIRPSTRQRAELLLR